ncbi:MAG: hypothetical protein K8F36_04590 [Melioribacteraceae bacterium]|nr:hypothetical protein [Melioribacteraceae bacterium]MCO6474281.1 hypothetical protein [Melioribacteraceae bacterium]
MIELLRTELNRSRNFSQNSKYRAEIEAEVLSIQVIITNPFAEVTRYFDPSKGSAQVFTESRIMILMK